MNDKTVHSVAHGVIRLEETAPDYGAERRRLRVVKYRGRQYRGGYHDFAIKTGGLEVFPASGLGRAQERLRMRDVVKRHLNATRCAAGRRRRARLQYVLILGPAGTGKSCFRPAPSSNAAVRRGEKAALFVFDEELGLLFDRVRRCSASISRPCVDAGKLQIEQVDAAELSPGEFSRNACGIVSTGHGAKTVVIDSLNGYQAAMPRGAGPHPAHA